MSSEVVARTSIGGVRVLVTDALPIAPTDGENARRMVRHGMADVLAWLGEKVGPMPGDPTHAMLIGDTLHASRSFAYRLKTEADR